MSSVIAPPRDAAAPLVPAARDDPLGHVLASPAGVTPAPLVQAVMQNALRALIAGFLHEPPLAHWYRNAFTVGGRPLAFHEVLERLLPRLGGATADEAALFSSPPRTEDFGGWVAALYRMCRRLLPAAPPPDIEAPASQARLGCRLPWAVRHLAAEMRGRDGLQLFLHGSLATCDATAYSDVDTLLMVSHGWLETAERLWELRRIVQSAQRWLYRFDPLQHHGFVLVTELDLARYARCYFPLELLSHAYAFDGASTPIRYRLRPSDEESIALLRRLAARLERLERGNIPGPATRYALKLALSEIMLLPSYYLQATGRVMYKRESFTAVRDELSLRAREAIDAVSAWRREWRLGLWDIAYITAGAWASPGVRRRMLARARGALLDEGERHRWAEVLPGARLMAAELKQRAESGG